MGSLYYGDNFYMRKYPVETGEYNLFCYIYPCTHPRFGGRDHILGFLSHIHLHVGSTPN